MLHPNFIKSQLQMVEEKLLDMERKYAVGSNAMKNYLQPQLEKLRKQKETWLRKEEYVKETTV